MRGIQVWRSGAVQSSVEEATPTGVGCLCDKAKSEWHLGEITSCQATFAEAISLAKELNNMHGIAEALYFAAVNEHFQRNPAEVERLASELVDWARSASGDPAEGIAWIETQNETIKQPVGC